MSSFLDRPEILQFIFHPRRDFKGSCAANATDHLIPVEEGVSIGCRFYTCGHASPNILFFHGNGEIVSDYDHIAPIYNQRGINLFVADYRGYGMSNGSPTFTAMISDAHKIFEGFCKILKKGNYTGGLFVMGRSLGSASVIELAHHYQHRINGLIIESGFASMLELFEHLGFPAESLNLSEEPRFSNLIKIRSVLIPTLIIHAEYDTLIPLKHAKSLFDNAPAEEKHLVIIAGADHNNIMSFGTEQYFRAVEEFIFKKGRKEGAG